MTDVEKSKPTVWQHGNVHIKGKPVTFHSLCITPCTVRCTWSDQLIYSSRPGSTHRLATQLFSVYARHTPGKINGFCDYLGSWWCTWRSQNTIVIPRLVIIGFESSLRDFGILVSYAQTGLDSNLSFLSETFHKSNKLYFSNFVTYVPSRSHHFLWYIFLYNSSHVQFFQNWNFIYKEIQQYWSFSFSCFNIVSLQILITAIYIFSSWQCC